MSDEPTKDASTEGAPKEAAPLPEIDFGTFVMSLATSALVHLGEIKHPDHASDDHNLPLAKQTIDILGMLREKTRGNLGRNEEQLLENLLYDLRMKYVAAKKR